MTARETTIRTKYSVIRLDRNGILWLSPDENADLDLKEVEACFRAYAEMGIGPDNKVLQIIDARGTVQMTKEARDYAAKHGERFFIASAIISSNLSIRLMVNFFNMFYKTQIVPFRLFDTEENAMKWLSKFEKG
ncbi:MAG: hypothetical protein ACJ77K_02875 [Bacteroidia bacterium]